MPPHIGTLYAYAELLVMVTGVHPVLKGPIVLNGKATTKSFVWCIITLYTLLGIDIRIGSFCLCKNFLKHEIPKARLYFL